RLEIETEVIKLKGQEDTLTPTTFKRTARTTVMVENSDTIVIGGIIGQDLIEEESKVPGLGDIPLLGWMFKTRAKRELRTNMFIFVTPQIVENPAEIARVTMDKEGQLGPAMEKTMRELFTEPDPLQAAQLTDRGVDLLSRGNGRGAMNYFGEALKIDPGNPYALINLGVALEREGRFDQAISVYEELIQNAARPSPGGSGTSVSTLPHLVEIAKENLNHAKNLRQK
ncbi:MAG: tetratricopeptide repeat protein, partial [Desulfofustis sp.]